MSPLQKQDFVSAYVYPMTVPAIRRLRDGDNPGGGENFPLLLAIKMGLFGPHSEQYLGGWKCHRCWSALDRAGGGILGSGAAGM